jgi:predicted nucleic acid-binding protein
MVIFVDTSAMYAFLDAHDADHAQAVVLWTEQVTNDARLITTNYIMLELISLVQRRLGRNAVRDILENLMPSLTVEWIDEQTHNLALRTVLAAGQRGISLVDAVSFEVMRNRGISSVFTFDRHFDDEGFTALATS